MPERNDFWHWENRKKEIGKDTLEEYLSTRIE
jgi:hypothetical protein